MSEATQKKRKKRTKRTIPQPNGGPDGIYDASSIKVLEGSSGSKGLP
jgi:hypothetical protein